LIIRRNKKILIYGFGNPGRQDDGLGIAFSEMTENWIRENNLQNISVDSNYQLNIEDAANISEYDVVIFADASKEDISSYSFTQVEPSPDVSFTMHAVTPAFVLDLCRKIYQKTPQAFLIHIKGYEWELKEGLTIQANQNLKEAFEFGKEHIMNPEN
jgi:hydrogenase maturation protease